MRCLITGNRGFVGQHLTKLLKREGMEVIGFDLLDGQDIVFSELETCLAKHRPDYIFHLAAVTSVPKTFEDPYDCLLVNTVGSVNLLESVRKLDITCKILLASSTEVYTQAIDDTPLDEGARVMPKTPYGVSKLAMEQMGAIYAGMYDMDIVITRTNNHTGPGQDGPFAVTSFARQIVEIEKGRQEVLKHGDLTSFRSYLDVRDVVRAYRLAIDMKPYIYNIASEEPVEMQQILDRLVANAKTTIATSQDTTLVRRVEEHKTYYKTSSKLKEAGWKPEYSLERTLNDTLNYWRKKK